MVPELNSPEKERRKLWLLQECLYQTLHNNLSALFVNISMQCIVKLKVYLTQLFLFFQVVNIVLWEIVSIERYRKSGVLKEAVTIIRSYITPHKFLITKG